MSDTLISHNCLYICKVKVDKTRLIDKVCNTLNTLLKYLICLLQRIRNTCSLITDLKELVVRDNNKCIHILLKSLYTFDRVSHTRLALKTKWLCDNSDCEDAKVTCHLCNDRGSACSCSTTHTTCYEYHVGVLDDVYDLFSILLYSAGTDLRLCTSTKTLGKFLTYLDLCCSSAE